MACRFGKRAIEIAASNWLASALITRSPHLTDTRVHILNDEELPYYPQGNYPLRCGCMILPLNQDVESMQGDALAFAYGPGWFPTRVPSIGQRVCMVAGLTTCKGSTNRRKWRSLNVQRVAMPLSSAV